MTEMVEFELVSPARLLMSEAVDMIVVPGMDGDIGVLPNHSLLMTTLRPGVIDVHQDGKPRESIFVEGGFCEVTPQRCTVLAEQAAPLHSLDRTEADARLVRAQEALASADDDGKEAAEMEVKVARAAILATSRQ